MEITLTIPDSLYARLLTGVRAKGSLALSDVDLSVPKTKKRPRGDFRAYPPKKYPRSLTYRLPHGSVKVNNSHISFRLRVELDESEAVPAQVVEDESSEAGKVIDRVLEDMWEYPYGIDLTGMRKNKKSNVKKEKNHEHENEEEGTLGSQEILS